MHYLTLQREKELVIVNMDKITWITLTKGGDGASLYHTDEKRPAVTLIGAQQVGQLIQFLRAHGDEHVAQGIASFLPTFK